MYEHPYFTAKVNEYEQQQLERAAELRRFIAEHPGQVVRRPEGALLRILRLLSGRAAQKARAPRTSRSAESAGTTDAARRGVPAGCEPATAR
ncbi:hypothetical protein [Microbacterium sp. SD291]|uniref:hypothetical protein n=1 Tax=Microbacterium sp. SD291 TaxID=2782007 RepID=UPI001A978C6F|nr:hypothetical protein [Microbacterium sp. SD291]MBO0980675.1 hypothetical protein [Microbacterium sp. SD291]